MDMRSQPSRTTAWHKWPHAMLASALFLSASLAGCGGTIDDGENVNLGIPYREQEEFNYCIPASIQMWRLHDDLPFVSQDAIFNWLGGPPCTAEDVPAGVNHFTNTNDAYLDVSFNPTATDRDEMIARQVTSYDNARPAITVVYPTRDHVGVINRGKYDDEGAYWTWEWLRFHNPDPAYGGNYYYGAQDWIDEFCAPGFSHCAQIVSSSATAGWNPNQSTYQPYLAINGGGGPVICNYKPWICDP